MDKVLEALAALTAKFDALITAQEASKTASEQAEATAKASEDAVIEASTKAVETYDEKIAAIDAVEGLLPSQVTALRKAAKEGRDITAELEAASAIVVEFQKSLEEGDDTVLGGRSTEAAKGNGAEYAGKVFG